ncbi:aminoglycoside phosphotransferase (APT) family kinase protein [Deinococcus metalli]|uniref:Aminoglycoside phosphotransferase n=1 Tax=Deinococcus metalli TaxID=1141878 RepID=A0A7W8KC08_9DEIO|nr:aminoglycoside phosphotransferase family protein [Deinococcus metalli]MBB5375311.1 aminoglycoside phosphotransferase (APT) family kinase protein [Deinococcus metalli]GHF30187.1 aminoglycoside phosphotransferase [Deinococcus metalli]
MTRPPASTGPDAAPHFPELEARYGTLTPMDSGMQSRVYAARGGEVVVKVYRNRRGDHAREAENLRRAGMAHMVVDVVQADGIEALIMRRFAGRPLRAEDIPRALPSLRAALGALHRDVHGTVDLGKVEQRLRRFRSALAAFPLDDLFGAVERPLEAGRLAHAASFCHLDLWQDNILISDGGEVLLIDWTKAAYDDPLRDLALLKTGTLDLLPPDDAMAAALSFLPGADRATLARYRAYIALTTLHDLYWFLMNEPYEFEAQRARKVPRARHVLARLPEH